MLDNYQLSGKYYIRHSDCANDRFRNATTDWFPKRDRCLRKRIAKTKVKRDTFVQLRQYVVWR